MPVTKCPACGHENPTSANFCSSCGTDLVPGGEHHTTIAVAVPVDSPAEEVRVDLAELDPGVGMLVVTRGPNSGSRFALDPPVVTAGRPPDSVIFLDDLPLSPRHADTPHTDDGHRPTDAGPLNAH